MRWPFAGAVVLGLALGAIGRADIVTGRYVFGEGLFQIHPFGSAATTLPIELTPDYPIYEFVGFTPDQTFDFAQLTSLSANFVSNSGMPTNGIPRLVVEVLMPSAVQDVERMMIPLGSTANEYDPGISDGDLNAFSGVNVLSDSYPEPDVGLGGKTPVTYSELVQEFGPGQVLGFEFYLPTDPMFPSFDITLNSIDATYDAAAVPEPGGWTLMALGLVFLSKGRPRKSMFGATGN